VWFKAFVSITFISGAATQPRKIAQRCFLQGVSITFISGAATQLNLRKKRLSPWMSQSPSLAVQQPNILPETIAGMTKKSQSPSLAVQQPNSGAQNFI
jgi:hypothetical protein